MKSLRKAMVSCVLMMAIIAPARASVGIGFAAPMAVVAGAGAMVGAAGGVYAGARVIRNGRTVLGSGIILVSVAAGFFGFLLLDGEQEAKFAELTPEGAEAIGVSAAELEIYNSEIEQVNAIAREIGSELVKQNSESVELARDLWMELGSELSPETMKTVIAIAQQG